MEGVGLGVLGRMVRLFETMVTMRVLLPKDIAQLKEHIWYTSSWGARHALLTEAGANTDRMSENIMVQELLRARTYAVSPPSLCPFLDLLLCGQHSSSCP